MNDVVLFVIGLLATANVFAQSGGPRTLEDLRKETVLRAETNVFPMTGISAEDAREAETHDNTNHVFIIYDGEADIVTGGKMIDPKVTVPGQAHGSAIEGGELRHVTKGDVITISAKTPHWWKDTSKTGSIGCYAVNIEQ